MSGKISGIQKKFGQYINFEGIRYTLSSLMNPILYQPHYQVRTIADINFEALRKNGIKYIVFDKDNTLTLPYEKDIYHEVKDSVDQCKQVYGYHEIVILSNSAGSKDDKDHAEAYELSQSLGIKVMKHQHK